MKYPVLSNCQAIDAGFRGLDGQILKEQYLMLAEVDKKPTLATHGHGTY